MTTPIALSIAAVATAAARRDDDAAPCRASTSRGSRGSSRRRGGGGGRLFVTGLDTHKRMVATNVGGRDPRGFCPRLLAGIERVEAADLKSPTSRSRHRPYQNQRIHRTHLSLRPTTRFGPRLADNSTKPGAVQDRAPFAFGAEPALPRGQFTAGAGRMAVLEVIRVAVHGEEAQEKRRRSDWAQRFGHALSPGREGRSRSSVKPFAYHRARRHREVFSCV
jgi:hypothetical protein